MEEAGGGGTGVEVIWGVGGGVEVIWGGGGVTGWWGGGGVGWWWWVGGEMGWRWYRVVVVGLWRNGVVGGCSEIGWETLMIVVLPQGCHCQLVKTSPPF